MADADTGFDVSSLLAPWMQQNPADMSQYGGPGQFGLSLLAASGPTPYRQPFMPALARGMLSGQASALENAKTRMGLAGSSIGLQQQMALWPYFMRRIQQRMGMQPQQPQGAPTPDSNQTQPAPSPQAVAAAQPQGNASAAAPTAAPLTGGAPSSAAPAPSPAPQGPSAPWMPPELQDVGLASDLALLSRNPQAMLDAAKTGAEYDPGLQTRLAFAKGPIAQDMMLLNAASAAGNPDAVRMATTKLQTDMGTNHIGSMSGIHTYQNSDGSWTTDNPSTGLRVNSVRGVEYLPGALHAFGARENVEAAQHATGELEAETGSGNGSGGSGGSSPVQPSASPPKGTVRVKPAAPATPPQQPAVEGHAAITTPNYIPPVLAAAGNVPQARGSTSLIALKTTQQHQAEEANRTVDELAQKADAGQTLLTQTAQIRSAAADFTPGRWADARGSVLAAIQGTPILRDALGADQLKALGSYQEGSKLSIQLQAMVTKQLGSREAAQVFTTMGRSVPGLTLSGDGLSKISAYLDGMARYNIAMAQFGQRMLNQGNAIGAGSVENSMIANTNPSYYIMAAAPANVRAEFLSAMPQQQRVNFLKAWDKAIKAGVAPKPNDYSDQGQ